MAIDLNDPFIQGLLQLFQNEFAPPDLKFQGRQFFRPVMEIEHVGSTSGFDVFGQCLKLVISTDGTHSGGLVVAGENTLGNLIHCWNDESTALTGLPPIGGVNTFVVSYDGRVGIMAPTADDLDGRLEVDQYDNTPCIVVKAFASATEDLLQFLDSTTAKVTYVNNAGEFHTSKDAFFAGNHLQVGSHTYDGGTFSGSVIGLKNLTSTSFTGAPTDGLNIAATNGKLRYLDSDGVVWRLPTGNPICDLHGLSSWNYDPTNATGEAAPLAGVIYLMKTLFPRSVQASTFRWEVTNNSAVPTNTYLGIYDLSGNLLTQTADVSAMMTTVGSKSAAMVSPPVMPPKYYYIAFLIGSYAGGGPKMSIAGVPAGIANTNLTAPSLRFASYGTGQTALPSTITMASQVSSANQFWVGTA